MGLVREKVYLYGMQVSACLVAESGDYNCFGEIGFFVMSKVSATETFEMFKNAYSEECLSRTGVCEWHKRFKEGQESLEDERKGRPSTSRI
jgi:hypothetical protein